MMELGIALYPEKSDLNEMKEYLKMCHEYGFEYLYFNTLSLDKFQTKEELIAFYEPVSSFAHTLGYRIVYDIAPRIFQKFHIDYHDLSVFHEMNAYGIRVDQPFSGNEEALMTFNDFDICVELQLDNDTHYIDTVLDYRPNRKRLSGCHNFYPHLYTAMSDEYFEKCNQVCIRNGLPITAYITSQNEGVFCQWEDTTKAVSIERHRDLLMVLQVKEFIARGNIDRLIVSNCYMSEAEAKQIAQLNKNLLTLNIQIQDELTETENKILFKELHFCRGDKSEYSIRSTQSRVKYKGIHFPLHNAQEYLEKGDIIIESSQSGMYAGELQIVTKRMKNGKKSSVVAKIMPEEVYLLDYIQPWQKFRFLLGERYER